MLLYIFKVLVSAVIIVAVSEVSKSNATLGALIKSLPLISVLSMIWIYLDTKNTDIISNLSFSTFWLVLPTLPMFLILPLLLRYRLGFFFALGLALICTLILYLIMVVILKRFGFEL